MREIETAEDFSVIVDTYLSKRIKNDADLLVERPKSSLPSHILS